MTHTQQMQKRARETYTSIKKELRDCLSGNTCSICDSPKKHRSIQEFLDQLIAEVVKETEEKKQREFFKWIETRLLVIVQESIDKALTKPDTEELSTNTKEV